MNEIRVTVLASAIGLFMIAVATWIGPPGQHAAEAEASTLQPPSNSMGCSY